jgi:flagellar protein FlaI
MCSTNIKISESDALFYINRVAIHNKKVVNAASPILEATLQDGSRLNATIPPASVEGPVFNIRKFRKRAITILDLIRNNTLTVETASFLWMCIDGLSARPANMIFCGGAGCGKTTMLNAASVFIPYSSRIITIEDAVELQLFHEHVIKLEAGVVGMDQLLANSLRMRPDRLIVGEVRGPEARSLFTAMNTGHEGCMGTLHANSSKESLIRITQDPMNVSMSLLSGLDLIVMMQKFSYKGAVTRHIVEISEVASGSPEDLPKLNALYRWDPKKRLCLKTGIPSRLREKIAGAAGISIKEFNETMSKRQRLLEEATDVKELIKKNNN